VVGVADQHPHVDWPLALSDTWYGVFPFAACLFLLLEWIADRRGASRSNQDWRSHPATRYM